MESMLNGLLAKLAELYRTDNRRRVRLRAEFAATLSGPFGCFSVTGADLTRDGAGVVSPAALPQGALVFLRITTLGLSGFAHVRHCSQKSDRYFLGLQFREQLTRDRADDAPGEWTVRHLARAAFPVWDEAEL